MYVHIGSSRVDPAAPPQPGPRARRGRAIRAAALCRRAFPLPSRTIAAPRSLHSERSDALRALGRIDLPADTRSRPHGLRQQRAGLHHRRPSRGVLRGNWRRWLEFDTNNIRGRADSRDETEYCGLRVRFSGAPRRLAIPHAERTSASAMRSNRRRSMSSVLRGVAAGGSVDTERSRADRPPLGRVVERFRERHENAGLAACPPAFFCLGVRQVQTVSGVQGLRRRVAGRDSGALGCCEDVAYQSKC